MSVPHLQSASASHGGQAQGPALGNVPRRIPFLSLPWLAAAALGAAGVYTLLGGPSSFRITSANQATVFIALFVLYAAFSFAPVWAWLTGPRSFVLGLTGFALGAREVGYRDIAWLRHHYTRGFTAIGLSDGACIRLYWPVWPEHESWIATLSLQTLDRLLAGAWQKLERGEDVDFGKKLRLNLHTVTIKGQPLPVRDILFVGSRCENIADTEYRKLRIGTQQKTLEIEMSGVMNPHVVFGLLDKLVAGGGNGTPAGR